MRKEKMMNLPKYLGTNNPANKNWQYSTTQGLNYLQQQNFENQTQIRVKDALKAGINPLAAMGMSSGYQPSFQQPMPQVDDESDGFSQALMGVNNIMSLVGNVMSISQQRKMASLALESARLGIDEQKLRLSNPPVSVNGVSSVGQTSAKAGIDSIAKGADIDSIWKPVYDLQGRPRLVVDQNVMEGDSDNAGYLESLKSAITSGLMDPISGRIYSEQLRMMIDDNYYQKTGHHIPNLSELYVSPGEVAIAALQLGSEFIPLKRKKD